MTMEDAIPQLYADQIEEETIEESIASS